jgi:predicted nucleic acid-binding protein
MILIDTGPLVAILDRADNQHKTCVETAARLPRGPVLSTWPCFTEAMYLLESAGGWEYQSKLWLFRQSGKLKLHDATEAEMLRMADLMDTYQDRPMDLADASLVACAEATNRRDVFTLDSDFYIYRLGDGSMLNIVPATIPFA